MKEASGELSMTAITIVAIAAIAALVTTLILPSIKQTISQKLHCSQVISCDAASDDGLAVCRYEDGDDIKEVKCPVD